MEFDESRRITLCKTEDYTIELEYNPYFAIVHLKDCEKFSKSVLKSIQSFLDDFEHFVLVTGYDGLYTASLEDKPEKLAYLLGFEFIGEQDNTKVYKYARNSSNRSGRGGSDGRGSDCLSES